MATKLTMLGTGHAMVEECYNTCFVLHDDGAAPLLVDGGGGNRLLHQFTHANIDRNEIRDIFVTHKHLDHIMGVIWMLRVITQNMNAGRIDGEARIYAHDEVIRQLQQSAEGLLRARENDLVGKRLHLIEVHDGEQLEVAGRPMEFFDIQSTKDKQFGFRVELPDGQKLVCCGDEPCSPAGEPYVKDADWLLHEAFCLRSQADIYHPYRIHHSTAADACELAERLGVRNVVLYHTEEQNLANRKELYTAEGAEVYNGNIYVPDDLETIELS